ncbi:unnamed protein product [Phyllotreta striolata]|uniref:Testis-expressed sequence 2 protein n=1 Tax=Phyllotreta striolata TaxID=444603 RepID=A0A9N9TQY0_PHYSR|nr:unnamed protein product [Phyllotreta striolata]
MKKKDGKITLGMLKGKPVTTSVPQISIKFHANAEEIEELYGSDDEIASKSHEKSDKISASSTPTSLGEPDSSPLKYFNKLGKRSTSVDVTSNQPLNASPPSDPWRFFTDIKGKITKSVEEKITEIKSRNNEEGSPIHKSKGDTSKSDLKTVKDSKENSSISDSEDLSESSISRTCGVFSTTEGVEMSSDEDTPSLDKDKKNEKLLSVTPPSSFKQKFRFFRRHHQEEGAIKINDLSKLCNINTENAEQVLPEESEGVENAVDALEESALRSKPRQDELSSEEVLKVVAQRISNIEFDNDNVINIREVSGSEIREKYFDCREEEKAVFAPTGFVDLRPAKTSNRPEYNYFSAIVFVISVASYGLVQYYSPYIAGLIVGIAASFVAFKIYSKLYPRNIAPPVASSSPLVTNKIVEIHPIKEYQPLEKFEGWVNEYPDVYSPSSYHVAHTQSVFLRLQGNLLRISHAKNKIPKRAMWNEAEIKANFTQHRIYNLVGAKVYLLPEGLAKIRHWSKKYPICIALAKDQCNFDRDMLSKLKDELLKDVDIDSNRSTDKVVTPKDKKVFNRFKKKEYPMLSQRFSKLTEGEEFDFFDSDSRASTPSADISDIADSPALDDEDVPLVKDEDISNISITNATEEDSSGLLPEQNNPNELKIYLFGRTDREKADWFRRLCLATHQGSGLVSFISSNPDIKETVSESLLNVANTELEYKRYMSMFKVTPRSPVSEKPENEQSPTDTDQNEEPLLWINALLGRVLFDCVRNATFIDKVKERIQRKLSTIKLPYFIEELLIPELSLGKTSPRIVRTGTPAMDERGLWIDLDINYEGMVILTLQTKLNLMRLKNPHAYDKSTSQVKSAIYHSDVDDSAESSSDEEGLQEVPNAPHDSTAPAKKSYLKYVDKLAESRFFQAATENRYIKKAMEGVSNTDLRLTVEIKSLVGTLVLNIPRPPTDRVWVGFRPIPELLLSVRPVVGEKNISYQIVTNWIEKKLIQEFQKVLVIPNMEDLLIPVMNSKLPY